MSPADPIPVSVVILTFNSAKYLPVCLEELTRARGVELEVVVVDNNSIDGSLDLAAAHPVVSRTIQTGANLGCAGGNNVGWRAATKPHIVMLNADCSLEPDALRELAAPLAADPGVGATGAKLYYPNSRRLQHAGGILHPNGMSEHHGMGREDDGSHDAPREVDYVTGACLAMRRADLEALGGLDEEFWPAYFEEADLCTRMRRSGRRILYVPTAVGYHWESVGLGILSPRLVRMSYRMRVLYVLKNAGFTELLFRAIPFELRWLVGPFARGFRRPVFASYAFGALFALRSLLRLNRRPKGIRARLPNQ